MALTEMLVMPLFFLSGALAARSGRCLGDRAYPVQPRPPW
jgi:hypothetical protein